MLWLWCRVTATAPIRPLAWESPYAAGVALKRKRKKKKKREREESILGRYGKIRGKIRKEENRASPSLIPRGTTGLR